MALTTIPVPFSLRQDRVDRAVEKLVSQLDAVVTQTLQEQGPLTQIVGLERAAHSKADARPAACRGIGGGNNAVGRNRSGGQSGLLKELTAGDTDSVMSLPSLALRRTAQKSFAASTAAQIAAATAAVLPLVHR